MNTNFLKAVAILVGTIIGAGILGIPAVIAKAGFLTGLLALFVLGIAIILLHLYIGEISLRTKKTHELTGYAEKYLGKWGKSLMAFSVIFNIYGALIAYLIGEGEIFSSLFGGSPVIYSLIFFVIASLLVFVGLKAIGKSELVLNILMLSILALIIVFSFKFMKFSGFTTFNIKNFFIPYGVIFFAFIGTTAIPEVKAILNRNKKMMKKALIVGTLIPLVVYALFAFVVIGVVGTNFLTLPPDQQIATIALGMFSTPLINVFANIFAALSMATSFLALALALKWVFHFDYGIKRKTAVILTLSVPLVITLLQITTFLKTLAIVGAIGGGLEGTLIVLMYRRAKKLGERKPEYQIKLPLVFDILLVAMFVAGAAFQFYSFF